MKKFMTVLLVIAVMFTFSFGSAFAYTAPTDAIKADLLKEASDELDAAKAELALIKSAYLRSISGVTVSYQATTGAAADVVISKDTIKDLFLDAAFAKIDAKLNKAYSNLVVAINNNTIGGSTFAEAVTAIESEYATVLGYYDEVAEITKVLTGVAVDVTGTDYDMAADADMVALLVEAEYEAERADALAEIAKAEAVLGNYSTTKPSTANVTAINGEATTAYMSNQEIATKELELAKNAILAHNFDSYTAPQANYMILAGFAGEATAVVSVDANGLYAVKYNKVTVTPSASGTIPTAETQDKAAKSLAEEKAYQIDRITGQLALKKAEIRNGINVALRTETNKTTIANYNKVLERIDADFAAVLEVATAQINYQTAIGEVGHTYANNTVKGYANTWVDTHIAGLSYTAGEPNGLIATCVNNAKLVDELEATAAKMLAETGLNGEAAYSATAVEKALKADIKTTYMTNVKGTTLVALVPTADVVKAEMAKVLDGTTVTFDKVVYPTVDEWTVTKGTTHDTANTKAAKAVIAETKAAIRAAKTVAEVDAAFVEGYKAFDAVPTLADQAKFQNLKSTKDLIAAYETKLAAVLQTKKAEYGTTKFAKDYEATDSLVANLGNEYLDTAYDVAGIEAGYAAAVAEIDGLKTKAELAAEQKAINDAIVAIKTVTLADEDAILALAKQEKAFNDYKALIGVSGYTTYGTATYVNAVGKLVRAELVAAAKAIGTVTLEDEAAIAALVAAADAYATNYATTTDYAAYSTTTLENALLAAKIDAVEKAIGAINAHANAVDAAAVKAAREAYDALAEDGLRVNANMYTKLIALENTVALQEEVNAEAAKAAAIADIEGLKIKANSSAKKGSITVKWTVSEEVEGVKYQVYKSTKAQKGYKKAITTSKTSFKNTKNIEKGTRYYYKVRAIAEVDGVTYYSDWSNKANRIAK